MIPHSFQYGYGHPPLGITPNMRAEVSGASPFTMRMQNLLFTCSCIENWPARKLFVLSAPPRDAMIPILTTPNRIQTPLEKNCHLSRVFNAIGLYPSLGSTFSYALSLTKEVSIVNVNISADVVLAIVITPNNEYTLLSVLFSPLKNKRCRHGSRIGSRHMLL